MAKQRQRRSHRQRHKYGKGTHDRKRQGEILHSLKRNDKNALRDFALSGPGLMNTNLRRRIWPVLLGFDSIKDKKDKKQPHKDESQIDRDIIRTQIPKYNGPEYGREQHREKLLDQLDRIVKNLFREYPWLSYYQGFHELAMFFMLVFEDEQQAYCALRSTALFYQRDAMGESLEPSMFQIAMLFTLIKKVLPKLYKFLIREEIPPYFAISWVITWFVHDINRFDIVSRIFDFCIATTPLAPVYISAALIIVNSQMILDCEPDFATIHTTLAKIPSNQTEGWDDKILPMARRLIKEYPPNRLQYMSQNLLSVFSVVNTYDQDLLNLDRKEPIYVDTFLPTNNGERHPLNHPNAKKKLDGKRLLLAVVTTDPITNLSITTKAVWSFFQHYKRPLLFTAIFLSTTMSAYAVVWLGGYKVSK